MSWPSHSCSIVQYFSPALANVFILLFLLMQYSKVWKFLFQCLFHWIFSVCCYFITFFFIWRILVAQVETFLWIYGMKSYFCICHLQIYWWIVRTLCRCRHGRSVWCSYSTRVLLAVDGPGSIRVGRSCKFLRRSISTDDVFGRHHGQLVTWSLLLIFVSLCFLFAIKLTFLLPSFITIYLLCLLLLFLNFHIRLYLFW